MTRLGAMARLISLANLFITSRGAVAVTMVRELEAVEADIIATGLHEASGVTALINALDALATCSLVGNSGRLARAVHEAEQRRAVAIHQLHIERSGASNA